MDPITEACITQQREQTQWRMQSKRALLIASLYQPSKKKATLTCKQEKKQDKAISLVDYDSQESDDSEATMDYDEHAVAAAVAAATATPPAAAQPAAAQPVCRTNTAHTVPTTLLEYYSHVAKEKGSKILKAGLCTHRSCPYCIGPLMQQRYALMERLIQLEHVLYGE